MDNTNLERRRLLGAATLFLASAGTVATMVPFVKSWQPSARTRVAGAPVEASIGKLEPGRMITVKWRGKPIWILRRTAANLQTLVAREHLDNLRDPLSDVANQPAYARNQYRSLRPDVFVAIGICTHLGCVPTYLSTGNGIADKAIYFCPCHGSKFDLAGRVYKNVPAPTNLVIPPHRFTDADTLVIGEDTVA